MSDTLHFFCFTIYTDLHLQIKKKKNFFLFFFCTKFEISIKKQKKQKVKLLLQFIFEALHSKKKKTPKPTDKNIRHIKQLDKIN